MEGEALSWYYKTVVCKVRVVCHAESIVAHHWEKKDFFLCNLTKHLSDHSFSSCEWNELY